MTLLYSSRPLERPSLKVLSAGIDPNVALFGRALPGLNPAVILRRSGIGDFYPIHDGMNTSQKTSLIERAGRLVCVNAIRDSRAIDRTRTVLKVAEEVGALAFVNGALPEELGEFHPVVFDGTSTEGFQSLARHIRDPEQYPIETLAAHLQPHEQQGEQL